MTLDLHIGIREKLASIIYVTGITMWRDDNDIRLFSHHGHCGMVAKNRASGHHDLDSSHPQRLCRYLSVLESESLPIALRILPVAAHIRNSLLTTVRGASPRETLSIFIEIILVMASIASVVQPAICGVSIKFSSERSWSSGSGGSLQNTSNAGSCNFLST